MTPFNQRASVAVQAILYTGANANAVIAAGAGVILPGRHGRLMINPPKNPNFAAQGPDRVDGESRNNLSGPDIIFPGQYVVKDDVRDIWYGLDQAVFEALFEA